MVITINLIEQVRVIGALLVKLPVDPRPRLLFDLDVEPIYPK